MFAKYEYLTMKIASLNMRWNGRTYPIYGATPPWVWGKNAVPGIRPPCYIFVAKTFHYGWANIFLIHITLISWKSSLNEKLLIFIWIAVQAYMQLRPGRYSNLTKKIDTIRPVSILSIHLPCIDTCAKSR